MGNCENCKNIISSNKVGCQDVPVAVVKEQPTPTGSCLRLEIVKNYNSKDTNFISGTNENKFENMILSEINMLRKSPKEYLKKLENAKTNIKEEEEKYYFETDNKKYLIENGVNSIDEAINKLKITESMPELKWDDDLKVDIFHSKSNQLTEEELFNSLEKKRLSVQGKYKKCYFTIDYIKNTEFFILFALMNSNHNYYKRDIILNRKITNYAVVYNNEEGKSFTSISTFA